MGLKGIAEAGKAAGAMQANRLAEFRRMLLDGDIDGLALILKESPEDLRRAAAFYGDQNSVVVLRASEAIRKASE